MGHKLGSESAFPRKILDDSTGWKLPVYKQTEGISKRLYIASQQIEASMYYWDNVSLKDICDYLGINENEYKFYIHYKQAMVKLAYELADELLKQE